jgi:hypothetical protein
MSLLGSKSAKKAAAPAAAKRPAAKGPAPAKGPGAAKGPVSTRAVVVEKPKANIYTMLLVLSLVAVVIGCLCLYFEMNDYGFAVKARL